MKTLKMTVSLIAVLAVLTCVCACAFADGGAAASSDAVWTYVEYIAGGLSAFLVMRWLTRKLKKDKNGKVEKDR